MQQDSEKLPNVLRLELSCDFCNEMFEVGDDMRDKIVANQWLAAMFPNFKCLVLLRSWSYRYGIGEMMKTLEHIFRANPVITVAHRST